MTFVKIIMALSLVASLAASTGCGKADNTVDLRLIRST